MKLSPVMPILQPNLRSPKTGLCIEEIADGLQIEYLGRVKDLLDRREIKKCDQH